MTQPNQDKVGERIREILKILIRNLYKVPDEDIINQVLLKIKEAMKVDEEKIWDILIKVHGCKLKKEDCSLSHCHHWATCSVLAHSICDYLEGR